jgi:hypothetical protein
MLFNPIDVKDEIYSPDKGKSGKLELSSADASVLAHTNSKVTDVFKDFSLYKTTHYVSAGLWSMLELTEFIVSKIGPCHLTMATWSMSQANAVRLITLLETRNLLSLKGVLDFRTKNRHPEAFQLAQTIFSKLHLGSCHAKVSVLRNENHCITISGSANYTNNPRIEAGVITPGEQIATFHEDWISHLYNNSNPFE